MTDSSTNPYRIAAEKLSDEIKRQGITDARVLEAIKKVPRHAFVPGSIRDLAYENRPLPIGEGQTVSQPFTVAYMTELLDVKPGMKVLEVGTGSGYQTAVLLELGAEVYTLERIKKLYESAKKTLARLGYTPAYAGYGNGFEGLVRFAPYDRIIVTAGAPHIPAALVAQLKTGGKMVIPVGSGFQDMVRITKLPGGEMEKEVFERFVFVPMLPGKK